MPKQHERGWENINVLAPRHIAAHYKSECPQVLKRGRAHSYTQEGASTNPGNYRMIAVSGTLYTLYATFHGPGLVYQTQKDPGHTIWFFTWQKHAAPAVYPATPQRCSTEDAEGLILAVHS